MSEADNTNGDDETISNIVDFRQRGNHEFSQGSYNNAVILYSNAISICGGGGSSSSVDKNGNDNAKEETIKKELLLNLCNRSACYYCMEKYEQAHEDAVAAWESSTTFENIKAAFRLSKSQLALGYYKEAQDTLKQAIDLVPVGADAGGDDDDEKKKKSNNKKVRKSFEDLLVQAYVGPTLKGEEPQPKSIKWAQRNVSIREFKKEEELGFGNFSDIYQVTHTQTGERFALKCITKKKAADLAKRQHPNVHNEIAMERRILMERMSPLCPNIVKMYHSFEDYETIYYLMDLHEHCGDLWSKIRFSTVEDPIKEKKSFRMVGCHESQINIWMLQIIDAIEFMHRNGVVHRDLKPENILLNKYGDVIVIDFGTAKDLIETDLNGPEFVGTPDFMSPEAVQGSGEMPRTNDDDNDDDDSDEDEENMDAAARRRRRRKKKKKKKKLMEPATTNSDLWALGAIGYILHTGQTPFWSPSPYLTFLKIKRCSLQRPWGIASDDAWDWIHSLMKFDPHDRFCADTYTAVAPTEEELKINPKKKPVMNSKEKGGYNPLRDHAYLKRGKEELEFHQRPCHSQKPFNLMMPTLKDLCIRACAKLVHEDSMDYELCDQHPPGDGSNHDFTRLDAIDQRLILHFLDKRKLLAGPESHMLYERFFAANFETNDHIYGKLDCKIREGTHDYVGMTQMNDDQGRPPSTLNEDPYAKPMKSEALKIVHLTNPLLVSPPENKDNRKQYIKLFKKTIATINRTRPKLVVVTGQIMDMTCRKLLARISDSIPVAIMDGGSVSTLPPSPRQQTFYTVWHSGIQVIVLQSKYLKKYNTNNTNEQDKDKEHNHNHYYKQQIAWLRELLEQSRMSKHPLYVFVDCDPRDLPNVILAKLARGRVRVLLGLCNSTDPQPHFETKFWYKFNENNNNKDDDDDVSIQSHDSHENEKDDFCMKICGSSENALRWLIMEEQEEGWEEEYTPILLDTQK